MIAVFRPALLAALVAASTPAVAEGQEPNVDDLPRRIILLEHQVAELEQRVRELEALINAEPSRLNAEPSRDRPVPASAKWRDLANWRQLRRGMKSDQVLALLGAPDRVEAMSFRTAWTWGTYPENASVDFDNGKLSGWSEPRQ